MAKLPSVLKKSKARKADKPHNIMCECWHCERAARVYIKKLERDVKSDRRKGK